MQITTIGLDLAKSWFQVHGVDADGKVVIRRKLKRSDVISFFKSLPHRHRGLCHSALLGTRADQARP